MNIIPTTRTSTGKLPLPRQLDVPDSSSNRVYVTQKISSGDMKDKMEQQLRQQRELNTKKRIEDLKQGKTLRSFDELSLIILHAQGHNLSSRLSSGKL